MMRGLQIDACESDNSGDVLAPSLNHLLRQEKILIQNAHLPGQGQPHFRRKDSTAHEARMYFRLRGCGETQPGQF